MSSIVTERFAKVHQWLKEEGRIKSTRQFAISLDFAPQSMDLILKGKRDVTIELVRKAASRYGLDANYLFAGTGPMFVDEKVEEVVPLEGKKITYVPVSAAAGYGDQFRDPIYVADLPTFSLPDPKFRHGLHRCFDVDGDSMEPTLYRSDRVVCSHMEQQYWTSSIRDQEVYVVITHGDVLVKRVVNRIAEARVLELHSDNSYYPPRVVDVSAISEVWHVSVKISPFMPSPGHQRNALYEEITDLKKTLNYLCEESKSVNKGIEHMVRLSRKATHVA